MRVLTMFAVVLIGHLITRIERNRRRAAVEAERRRAEENLELQRKAQEAELAAQAERGRIAREIHDGIAQSLYALTLSLETCADLAAEEQGPLRNRLQSLVPLAQKTLLEARQYIFDLKPLLEGERDLERMVENQVNEFRAVAATPITLRTEGTPAHVPVATATAVYRILQEGLANVLRHANARAVQVVLGFDAGRVSLVVADDGVGFERDGAHSGDGLGNMRQRAEELGGSFAIAGGPGQGTRVSVTLPAEEEVAWTPLR